MQRTKQEIAHTKLKLKCNLDFKKKHFKIILLYFQSYLFKNFYLGSIDSQYRKKMNSLRINIVQREKIMKSKIFNMNY